MYETEQNRLKQNYTFLKTRLVDLDPILDRLLEKSVLSFDQTGHLRNIHNGRDRFNQFMTYLMGSPEENAYHLFIDALNLEKYESITRKLEATIPKGVAPMSPRRDNIGKSKMRIGNATGTDGMLKDLLTRMDQLETARQLDKKEYEEKLHHHKSSTNHEISQLKSQVTTLQQSEREFQALKRKYNILRKEQDNFEARERELRQQMERQQAHTNNVREENDALSREMKNATAMLQEAQKIVEEHKGCEEIISQLRKEKKSLEDKLAKKEAEVEKFKTKIHTQADAFRSMETLLQQNMKHIEASNLTGSSVGSKK